MLSIKDRYSIVPQMKFYDQISCEYNPFIMFFNKRNFKSKNVNTDEMGFRLNYFKNNLKKQSDLIKENEISIVIGGSSVFGFGASSDNKTISSFLSKKTNDIFINFGATAFNTKQELLLFLNFFQKIKKIKNVIFISGINDLYLGFDHTNNEWGNFFFKNKYELIHNLYQIRNRLDKKILYYLYKLIKGERKNPLNLKFKDFFTNEKCFNNNKSLDFKNLELNFEEIFNLWSGLSKIYNFNIFYFLQPLPAWFKKPLCEEELKLFDILDNTNDKAHNKLKLLSELKNYENYLKILQTTASINKIKFYDLNHEFSKIKDINKWLFVDRVHMTDLGYDLSSDIILNFIK